MVGRQSFRGFVLVHKRSSFIGLVPCNFNNSGGHVKQNWKMVRGRSLFPKDWDHNLQCFAETMAGYAPMFLPNL